MWKELTDYLDTCDTEKRTEILSTKIWQMTQSNATKAEHLENDFVEVSSKTKEFGLVSRRKQLKRFVGKRVQCQKIRVRVKASGPYRGLIVSLLGASG